MSNDVFCKILNKEISSDFLYEDDKVIVIKDINPSAPIHILIIPKEHIATVNDFQQEHATLFGHMALVAKKMAKEFQTEDGYKLIVNCGEKGGQVVPHLHLHLLGGF